MEIANMQTDADIMKAYVKFCFTTLIVFAAATSIVAEAGPAKDGYYIGVSSVSNAIEEEFDDTTFLTNGTMIVDIPKIKNGSGYGLYWGSRTGASAVEIDYITTEHNTTSSLLGDSKATYTAIEVNGKLYFNTTSNVQPFFLYGIGLHLLTIKNNTITISGANDSDFTGGRSFNIGGGLAYYLTPQWFLSGAAVYRYGSLGKVEDLEIDGRLGDSGLSYSVSMAYVF
jgi:hypothetical protein